MELRDVADPRLARHDLSAYFVAGAIYSGFGMVMTLLIITRQTMNFCSATSAPAPLDMMSKVIMLTGSISATPTPRVFQRLVTGNI